MTELALMEILWRPKVYIYIYIHLKLPVLCANSFVDVLLNDCFRHLPSTAVLVLKTWQKNPQNRRQNLSGGFTQIKGHLQPDLICITK